MSEVFSWWSSDKYAEYSGKTDEDERKISWDVPGVGDPLPPLSEWKTPLLTQYLGEKGKRKPRKIGDSPSVGRLISSVKKRQMPCATYGTGMPFSIRCVLMMRRA